MLLLALLMIAISCYETPDEQEIALYAGRPDIGEECIANGDSTCTYGDGEDEWLPVTNRVCLNAVKMPEAKRHVRKMEKFFFMCKKHGQCK